MWRPPSKMADLLIRKESETKFIGPEHYFGLSYRPVRQTAEEWIYKEHTM